MQPRLHFPLPTSFLLRHLILISIGPSVNPHLRMSYVGATESKLKNDLLTSSIAPESYVTNDIPNRVSECEHVNLNNGL